MGYYRAGFDVTGVDINPQPNYPFEFYQADAIEFVLEHGHKYAAITASPPCQVHSALSKGTNKHFTYEDLVPQTREALSQFDVPTVIENVPGKHVRKDLVLCGEMFGLSVIRHRYFETSVPIQQIPHKPHRGRTAGYRHGVWYDGPYFAVYGKGGGKGSVPQWQQAMGIGWTSNRKEIAEAIPPAYTEYIGTQLMAHLTQIGTV